MKIQGNNPCEVVSLTVALNKCLLLLSLLFLSLMWNPISLATINSTSMEGQLSNQERRRIHLI